MRDATLLRVASSTKGTSVSRVAKAQRRPRISERFQRNQTRRFTLSDFRFAPATDDNFCFEQVPSRYFCKRLCVVSFLTHTSERCDEASIRRLE